MKTKKITELKKEILVIEFPEGYELAGVTHGAIYYYDNQMNYEDYPLSILVEGSYTLLDKPDEISEEDAKTFVDRDKSVMFEYKNYNGGKRFLTALESFNSALESEIYWVNPHGKEEPKCIRYGTSPERIKNLDWRVAQEKTFDKKRTLIFVKN